MSADFDSQHELMRAESFRVLRMRGVSDGRRLLIKETINSSGSPTAANIIKAEFEALQQIHHPAFLRPTDLSRRSFGMALIADDPGGLLLSQVLLDRRLAVPEALLVAVAIAGALAEMHRRQWVHHRLYPGAIAYDSEAGTVCLLDIGAAGAQAAALFPSDSEPMRSEVLPYMAPEQTGRMNRVADHRADLYSLGVILYESLTGIQPFKSTEPLEVVHAQIARMPPSPSTIAPNVPRILSDLTMKLLAKNPELRYQSATGLLVDLERCQREWLDNKCADPFELGAADRTERFLAAHQLYGRDRELAQIMQVFESASKGPAQMLLISGDAGVGKTALTLELQKPVVRKSGYFVRGKFDLLARADPYRALLQALTQLLRRLLAEDEQRLADLRKRLAAALGTNARVLAEVLPEFELLMGPQLPAARIPSSESHNRLIIAVHNLLQAVAEPAHPLVIFLDDLQWADAATLQLLTSLVTSPSLQALLFLGAYRDNEVDAEHPLTKMIRTLSESRARLLQLQLGPLAFTDLVHLLQEALHSEAEQVHSLAELVRQKTGGNPFFAIQFLQTLYQERHIRFEHDRTGWTVDLDAVARLPITDNVVDLMTRRIRAMPAGTQHALRLAATIGNHFDVKVLSIVCEQTQAALLDNLRAALDEGLLIKGATQQAAVPAPDEASSLYSFLHDRVQQAAYSLTPMEDRAELHLCIGRLLLARWEPDTAAEEVFDLASHVNLGAVHVVSRAELLQFAQLNLCAANRARATGAFEAGLTYFQAGERMLAELPWEEHYEEKFELALGTAECEFLCLGFAVADRRLHTLLSHARTRIDQTRIYIIRVLQYENLSRYDAAVVAGRAAMALFGLTFPVSDAEKPAVLAAELQRIDRVMGDRSIASLLDLPQMDDPEQRILIKLLANLHTSWFLSGDKPLTLLNTAMMVRLSLEHGNAAESAYAYALFAAMLLGPMRGDYRSAYEFGRVAIDLSARQGDLPSRARVLMTFSWAISIYGGPIAASLPIAREAFRLGNESGAFGDAVYANFNEIHLGLLAHGDLRSTRERCAKHVEYAQRVKMTSFADATQLLLQWGAAFEGLTVGATTLTSAGFDESEYQDKYGGQSLFEMFYFTVKLSLLYYFGDYSQAAEVAEDAERAIMDFPGTIWDVLTVYYQALTLCALYDSMDVEQQTSADAKLNIAAGRLHVWASNSPHVFRCMELILAAQRARVSKDGAAAVSLFLEALEAAGREECPRELALASELFARFWLDRNQSSAAAAFMESACQGYAAWGAVAKVRELRSRYAGLLERSGNLAQEPATSPADVERYLDINAITRAARAIASETNLAELLRKLMRLALENAGAERGVLLQQRDGRWTVIAEISAQNVKVQVLDEVAADVDRRYANSVVQYVGRTTGALAIDDARFDDRFANDPYLDAGRTLSILCVPIGYQGRFNSILYLENSLTAQAFSEKRIQVMNILSADAAIALENARLYESMKGEVQQRREAEAALRAALVEVQELKNRLEAENVYLQQEIREQHNFHEMIGGHPSLLRTLRQVEMVAGTDATVLVTGETGVGKELVARAIHERSTRKARPLVKVNCSAISAGLVESELFGHVKGAFTGAHERRTGRFELADGGTIFLDEIGELPLEAQVKLLRVLQEREFEPVGSSHTMRADVRVIAATNRDLAKEVERGKFRADLLYRLNVFPVHVPALRERASDIPQLVMHLLARSNKRFGRNIEKVSQQTMERLTQCTWPGNIRDLQNTIERAVISSSGPTLEIDWSLLASRAASDPESTGAAVANSMEVSATSEGDDSMTLKQVERRHIIRALRQTHGVVEGPDGAAKLLNLSPSTMRFRIRKLCIARSDYA